MVLTPCLTLWPGTGARRYPWLLSLGVLNPGWVLQQVFVADMGQHLPGRVSSLCAGQAALLFGHPLASQFFQDDFNFLYFSYYFSAGHSTCSVEGEIVMVTALLILKKLS